MKRILTAAALAACAIASWGATLTPIQLLNPAGSTAGQVIASTGATTPPVWGGIPLSAATGTLAVNHGGTGVSTASGTALDNIAGFASTGFLTRTGAGTYAFQSTTNGITLGNLAQSAANTVLANATGSTANVAAFTMPSCSTSVSALNWTTSTGFTCNAGLITAATVSSTYAPLASPTLTGTPAAPTASATTNTTQIATTAMVNSAITSAALAGSFTTLAASGNDALLYQNSSGQSIPSAANTTVTTWTKVSDRVNANFNASTGTFTAPVTGYYLVSAQLTFVSAAGVVGTAVQAIIVANSVTVATGNTAINNTGASNMTSTVSAVVQMTAGQTMVIQAFQNSGSARALSATGSFNILSINRIP